MVRKHKEDIQKMSDVLLKEKTIDLKRIVSILGKRPFKPRKSFQ